MSKWRKFAKEAMLAREPGAEIDPKAEIAERSEIQEEDISAISAISDRGSVSEKGGCHAQDYLDTSEERAAIAERDGGLSRADADRLAMEVSIVLWLNDHPPTPIDPDTCPQCGEAIAEDGSDALPILTATESRLWVHAACHRPWMKRRRMDAEQALMWQEVSS